jgi:transcriptional antiterminator NusG
MEHKPNESDTKDITKRAWYVIHTFSGYENKVKANLEKKVIAQDLGDVIFEVVVPMREETEFKDGKRRVVKRKLIPGYVMVNMIVNNYSWFVVRNTNGVTGFVGSEKEPIPLTLEEAKRILVELAEARPEDMPIGFEVGDRVRIISGLFENRVATVKEIDLERRRVKVLVENAPVDLDVSDLEKM